MRLKRFFLLLTSATVLIAVSLPSDLTQAATYFYDLSYLGGGSCSTSGFSVPESGIWSLPPGGGITRYDNGTATASNFAFGASSAILPPEQPNGPVPSTLPYIYTVDYFVTPSTSGGSAIYHTILTVSCGVDNAFSVNIQNGAPISASSAMPAHCIVGGDGRLNGLCGDRIAVYCNASATPPNIDIWVIDNNGKGADLLTIKLADLTSVAMGAYMKNLGEQGTVFAGVDKQGNGYAALQGGPFQATAKGDWAKVFTCTS